MKRLIIIGAGDQAIITAMLIRSNGLEVEIVGYLDDDRSKHGASIEQIPILGGTDLLAKGALRAEAFVIGIGSTAMRARHDLYDRALAAGLEPMTLIDKRAIVHKSAKIGEGCVVFAGAIIAAFATLGKNNVVYGGAVIDHHCTFEENVYIAPGAAMGGRVQIGKNTLVGIGARILPRKRIGADAVIAAGAVVTKDVPTGAVMIGVPAREKKRM